MNGSMTPRLLAGYLLGQGMALAVVPFLAIDGWARAICQLLAGWAATVFVVVGVRVHRPQGAGAYYLLAASVFLNSTGVLVEAVLTHVFDVTVSPTLADLFWLSVYPGLVASISLLIRHRRVGRDWTLTVDATIIAVGVGLLAWVFIIRPAATRPDQTLLAAAVVTAYPVADLVVLAMMVRLLLGGSAGNTAFRIMIAALLCLLACDLGWSISSVLGVNPGPVLHRLLIVGFQLVYILMGACVLHPSVREVARPVARPSGLSAVLLAGLTGASLVAPAVLILQTLRGAVTDGVAIAVSSAALFALVVVRMTQLLRRLGERTEELGQRNRDTRLVLDTVDQGLLRVADDGRLGEERSAMIDRWFGPFSGRPLAADYFGPFDPAFAGALALGLETLREGVMPAEVCLTQLPSRLQGPGARALAVSYLPVGPAGPQHGGLLLVIDDVTERLRLTRQEAEQRELLAIFEGWTRDRPALLALVEEATALLEQATATSEQMAVRQRCLHTLKGNAGQAGFNVVAELCHAAEDEVEERGDAPPGPALQTLQTRWSRVTDTLASLAGERGRDVITVRGQELDVLCQEVARGLSTSETARRLSSWRCEGAEQPLQRLARHARTLAARLGKGALQVDVDGGGLRLDTRRWGPFWAEMVHVVNNAVDHGLEGGEARLAAGKPERPRLRLAALTAGQRLVVEVEDDGRGIDWSAIERSARRAGLPAATRADLTAALLSSGVTSRARPDELSGRGVGMSAVRARVEQLQGEVAVSSRPGAGTCWRFSFPLSVLAAHEGTATGAGA
jgi:HPt (histidine-containing phosphotransfer) domain-containing protein/two-component sensor histidine kinase